MPTINGEKGPITLNWEQLEMTHQMTGLEERRRRARMVLAFALGVRFSALIVAIVSGIVFSRLTEQISELGT